MTQSKSIFVTGAGSGIGAATARLFHQNAWTVGAYDFDVTSVQALAKELGAGCIAGPLDVTDRVSVDSAIADFAESSNGQLDVLCNSAGVFYDVAFAEQSEASLDHLIAVNTKGVLNCAQSAFGLLKATEGAKLINIGSAASIYGIPNETVYSATKFFVRGVSEALQLEWREHDIGVSLIMPGYVSTPMVENADRISWAERFGVHLTAEDVAGTIWQAAHSNRLYWPLPKENRLLMTLVRKLPLRMVPWFTGKVFYG